MKFVVVVDDDDDDDDDDGVTICITSKGGVKRQLCLYATLSI